MNSSVTPNGSNSAAVTTEPYLPMPYMTGSTVPDILHEIWEVVLYIFILNSFCGSTLENDNAVCCIYLNS